MFIAPDKLIIPKPQVNQPTLGKGTSKILHLFFIAFFPAPLLMVEKNLVKIPQTTQGVLLGGFESLCLFLHCCFSFPFYLHDA